MYFFSSTCPGKVSTVLKVSILSDYVSGMDGVVNLGIASELSFVLMMMEFYGLGFLELPGDGEPIPLKWKELKSLKLVTGSVFVPH